MKAIDSSRRLWFLLGGCVTFGFLILGFFGREVYRLAPPIPERIVSTDGTVLATRDDILTGQQVWQSTGGQQLGSIWGHGAYQAPDWTADWLHREAETLLNGWSLEESGTAYAKRDSIAQAALRQRLIGELRTNTFDAASGNVIVSGDRAAAIRAVASHYDGLFGGAPELTSLRESYAMQELVVPDAARRTKLTWFFFWTSWAAATERPGASITYTNNWPHEPLVNNHPSSAKVIWSIISVVLLLGALGAIIWWRASREGLHSDDEVATPPKRDPFSILELTPSMRAVAKYVATVTLLFVVQVILGIITAHYTVEGQSFYGFPLGEYLPYSLTRTWHIQTAMFWIATAFLAVGLFIAPLIGGREPKYQRLGVNVLFGALLVVVGGSLAGEYFAIHQKLNLEASFWIGTQGYEYVDLGRVWQIGLFVGLVLWLVLTLRALWPALQRRDESRTLVRIFAAASVAVGLMYGAGFFFPLRWMRVVGDVLFAFRAGAYAWFMVGLVTGSSYESRQVPVLKPLPVE